MKQRKQVGMNERRKRQITYLTLLLAAAFLAAVGQGGWWLAIAIAAGVAIDEIAYLFTRRKSKPEDKDPRAAKREEPPEKTTGAKEPESSDSREEKNGKGPKG